MSDRAAIEAAAVAANVAAILELQGEYVASPMTGDVDLFTGEVVDLVLRRAGARGVQESMF